MKVKTIEEAEKALTIFTAIQDNPDIIVVKNGTPIDPEEGLTGSVCNYDIMTKEEIQDMAPLDFLPKVCHNPYKEMVNRGFKFISFSREEETVDTSGEAYVILMERNYDQAKVLIPLIEDDMFEFIEMLGVGYTLSNAAALVNAAKDLALSDLQAGVEIVSLIDESSKVVFEITEFSRDTIKGKWISGRPTAYQDEVYAYAYPILIGKIRNSGASGPLYTRKANFFK